MRKKTLLASLAVSAAMVAGACGGGASIVGSYSPGTGASGGTLLVGDYQDVDSLNPFYYSTVMSANVLATVYDGTVLVAAVKDLQYVYVWTRSTAGVWSSASVYDAGSALSFSMCPCLTVTPSGRVLLFHNWEITSGNTQLRCWYSDDNGATWSLSSRVCQNVIANLASAEFKRLRCAYMNGAIVLVAWVQEAALFIDAVSIYASVDMGNSFSSIGDIANAAFPDVVVANGSFLVGVIKDDGSGNYTPYEIGRAHV